MFCAENSGTLRLFAQVCVINISWLHLETILVVSRQPGAVKAAETVEMNVKSTQKGLETKGMFDLISTVENH